MYSSISRKKHKKGQGLVEYALILVLVGIVVIASLMILGPVIGSVFSDISSSLSSSGVGAVDDDGGEGGGHHDDVHKNIHQQTP